MFGRRKNSDGFEWHKYVRTTIKLRREERRQRILEARRAAVHQAGAAGVALAAGSRAAGSAALGGAKVGLGVAGLMAQAAWNIVATVAAIAWHHLASVSTIAAHKLAILLQPAIVALARPNIGGPVAIAGAIALAMGVGRSSSAGLDREATVALAIGILLLIAALPLLSSLTGIRLPRLSALGISPRVGFIAVAVAIAIGGVAWVANGGKTNLAGISSQLPLVGGSKPLQGRAEAAGGDLLRVAGTTVRLAGIEAPERQQTCGAGSRRYRCGAAGQRPRRHSAGSSTAVRSPARSAAATAPGARWPRARAAGSTSTASWYARATRSPAAACLRATRASKGRPATPRPASGPPAKWSVLASSAPRPGTKPSAAPQTAARSRGW